MSLNDYAAASREYEQRNAKAFNDIPVDKKLQDFYNEEVERMQLDQTKSSQIDYCFAEGDYLDELRKYIDSTYGQHYAKSKIQSTEFIMDCGHGEGFCLGNVIKYAQRYGKKAGKNRADLLKVCHYAIMMLHVHDRFNTPEKE